MSWNRVVLFVAAFLLGGAFVSAQEQTVKVGRELGKESISGKVPDFSKNAFTFAMRFKPLAKGGPVDKANPDSGMLFSVASGYYDGARASYSWPNRSVSFEIGREAERSSLSVQCPGVSPFVMHDVVCTWDGKVMKLYVDGRKPVEREYAGPVTHKNAPIKVGFAHFGVGYCTMYVDELDYHPRAFTEEETAARFAQMPAADREKLAMLAQYETVFGATSLNMTEKVWRFLLDDTDIAAETRASVVPGYARWLVARGELAKAGPYLLQEADATLAGEVPPEESVQEQNVWLSDFFSLLDMLRQYRGNDPDGRFGQCYSRLRAKFSEQARYRDKIARFESSMLERSRKMESAALARFQAVAGFNGAGDAVVYMSPAGKEDADGSAARPFARLAPALAKASELSKTNKTVVIEVADGVYAARETAKIENAARIPGAGTIHVRPAKGAKPVFSGKVRLDRFAPVSDPAVLKRLDRQAAAHILVCDLKACGVTDYGKISSRGYGVGDDAPSWTDLYVDDTAMTLARWPNENEKQLDFGEVVRGPKAAAGPRGRTDSNSFHYDFDRPNRWQLSEKVKDDDIWATGLFCWEWAGNTRRVLDLDREKKLVTVDYHDISGRFHYYFRNILEELDVPGEYYIDRKNGLLYLYPPQGCDPVSARVELPVFEGPFVSLRNVDRIVFHGLVMTGCRTSIFVATNCTDCYIDGCTLEQASGHAVIMNGGSYDGVFNSTLRKLGSCGVRYSGGDRKTLEPAMMTLHNSIVHTFAQVDRAYAPAVQTRGCGMIMTNNLIYDSPHHAFRTDGNDQYVARNEVHSVVYEYSDQAGIDIYCDPYYRGIVIEKNLWHHIGSSLALCGQAGIRLDDSISGVVMKDNVFYRSSGGFFGGIQIHGGKDNICAGNLFVRCRKAFSFSPWGTDRYVTTFVHGKTFESVAEGYRKLNVYPFLDEMEKHINRNYIFDNEAIDCETFQTSGNNWDLFVGNRWRTTNTNPTADGSIPSPGALRGWLERVSGRSLKEIGLIQGQNSVDHAVSPHFSEN